jgi:hypothetical protein
MFKFLGCILKIFLSISLLFALSVISALIAPYFMAQSYEDNETPHIQFRVLVETNDNDNNQTSVRAVRWDEYIDEIDNYSAYTSPSEGDCNNVPLWCQAKNIDSRKQLIELRYGQENFFLYNKYYVTNGKITPLYCRITDRGHAMLGFFISIIVTPIALLFSRFCIRKFKNSRD